ncbi:glycerophosphoryl diester phosphodiesterase [Litoreibacter ponti]|uniref:Glycerophosphoryl diester phosphodiesterase n=1 Tax=Litoreibacter ponti TaxID=1510457 RepID=A0A2T6BPS3_9RHOB|nr:glycerophosphodiester phosphodiesterase family protein [Litoreibacter ponti]PTX58085.1 glycerophosphoryl diester phosphodiesterase [Litoreibacter ponti]
MTPLTGVFTARPLAHRGLHDRARGIIENSPSAFEAAIAAGYGIELDVQLSADRQPMVFHDYDMARLTGQKGPIQTRSAETVRAMTLSGSDDQILDLGDVLKLIGGRVPVLIEVKDQDGAMGPNIGPLEDAVAQQLRDYAGEAAVMSFNPYSAAYMAKALPDRAAGLVTSAFKYKDWAPLSHAICDRLRDIPDFDPGMFSFISHEAPDLDRPRVAELRDHGATILCWTIKSQAQADAALKIAHNITFEGFAPA